jgi:predicted PurR-regulated permease PerM
MTLRARPWATTGAPQWIVAAVAVLFFLRMASTLLIPIALAVLISYALEPLVAWLERHHVPRLAGAAVVLVLLLGAAAGGIYTLRDDAMQVVEALPKATERAREFVLEQFGSKAKALQDAARSLGQDKSSSRSDTEFATGTTGQAEISGSIVQRAANAVFAFAGHFVVIVFLIYFLLISGQHMRKRLVEISGPEPEGRRMTATIINDINTQIQQYLLVLLATAVMVGAATWTVLALMRVEHAAMWGILAGVFNSIPYFGPVVVSGGLFAVGMAQGGGIAQALQMSGAAIAITSLEGWLLTPFLMGKAERMSALAVFLGLLLWTWVWGAWGTILAVPMLAIIKSVADHVPRFKPVGRLMAP